MSSRPLSEDTLGDKVVRFVIGAVLGVGVGWASPKGAAIDDAGHYLRSLGLWATGAGLMAALFGNRFLELSTESRRKNWDDTGLQTRPTGSSTAGDRVMYFVVGAVAGAGIGMFRSGGVHEAAWPAIALHALVAGAACALLGYRFTRLFTR